MLDHNVEKVPMQNQIPPTVSRDVDRRLGDVYSAEMGATVVAQEFIMVAGNVDDSCSFASLTQQFLYDVVMRLRPVPPGAQLPAVDDIANEVDGVGLVMTKKIKESSGLAPFGAEMHVGKKDGSKSAGAAARRQHVPYRGFVFIEAGVALNFFSLMTPFVRVFG
jgi:hypothetical protein